MSSLDLSEAKQPSCLQIHGTMQECSKRFQISVEVSQKGPADPFDSSPSRRRARPRSRGSSLRFNAIGADGCYGASWRLCLSQGTGGTLSHSATPTQAWLRACSGPAQSHLKLPMALMSSTCGRHALTLSTCAAVPCNAVLLCFEKERPSSTLSATTSAKRPPQTFSACL